PPYRLGLQKMGRSLRKRLTPSAQGETARNTALGPGRAKYVSSCLSPNVVRRIRKVYDLQAKTATNSGRYLSPPVTPNGSIPTVCPEPRRGIVEVCATGVRVAVRVAAPAGCAGYATAADADAADACSWTTH